jgi:hypothetical protein
VLQVGDIRVHDQLVLQEIQLYGEVVIAATTHDGPLTSAQLDAILGVERPNTAG